MAAEPVTGVGDLPAVLAAEGGVVKFGRVDHTGEALDLGQEDIPEAEHERGTGDDEQGIRDDGEAGGLVFDLDGAEDGGAEETPADSGGDDGDGEHNAGEPAAAAAFAHGDLWKADVMRMDLGRDHEILDTLGRGWLRIQE